MSRAKPDGLPNRLRLFVIRRCPYYPNEFGTLDALKGATYEDLIKIREIGPEVAKSILAFFAEERNLNLIDKLLKGGVAYKAEKAVRGGPLEGKTFVFTGTLKS